MDNIFPDLSNSKHDIKYAQLRILGSDVRRATNRGDIGIGSQPPPIGTGSGDDPIPPGGEGCKKIYVANLNQSGEADPAATVFENTLGPIVWTRSSAGIYYGTLASAFTEGFTWLNINKDALVSFSIEIREQSEYAFVWISEDQIAVIAWNQATGAGDDNLLKDLSIEIRTYCSSNCTEISTPEFSLPDGVVDVPYHVEIPIGGTSPYIISIDDKPDWMTIVISGGMLIFDGTPDATTDDPASVNLTITNCNGAGSVGVGTFISVDELGSSIVSMGIIVEPVIGEGTTKVFGVYFGLSTTGETGWIDWGDGSPLEQFVLPGSSNQRLLHTYPSAGAYSPVFYFDHDYVQAIDMLNAFVFDDAVVGVTSFSVSGITALSYLNLFDVTGDLADIVIPATVVTLWLANFLGLDLTYGGGGLTLTACANCTIGLDNAPVSYVNDVYIALDANGITSGVVDTQQAGAPAPPSGLGITAQASLIVKSWSVTSD